MYPPIANSFATPSGPQYLPQTTMAAPRITLPSSIEAIMGDQVELLTLTKIYFSIVHNYGFLCFIHEPSFRKLLDENKTPRQLTLIMMACALRFSGNASDTALERADTLFEEAIARLRPRFFTGYGALELMAVMLAQAFEHSRGRFLSSWMLAGFAVRRMQFHSLHIFDETYGPARSIALSPLLKREALRRLAWSVWYMDTMMDAGRFGIHNLTEDAFRIRLPASESSFLRGIEAETCTLQEFEAMPSTPTDLDKAAYVILLATVRRRLNHFVSFDLRYKNGTPTARLTKLRELEQSQEKIEGSLPTDMVYSQENLYVHAKDGQLFVLLHVLKHACSLIIGKAKAMITQTDPTMTRLAESACRTRIQHSISLSEVVQDALRHGINCDPHVGFQAYSALETLLLQPTQLRLSDPSVDPHDPQYTDHIKPLLHLIRQLSGFFTMIKYLRVEACARLIHHGWGHLLNVEDVELSQNELPLSDSADVELDFESFRWHRLEHVRQRDPALEAPLAAEALLDLGGTAESGLQSSKGHTMQLSGSGPTFNASLPTDGSSSQVVGAPSATTNTNRLPIPDEDSMRWNDLGYEAAVEDTILARDQEGNDQSFSWPLAGQAMSGSAADLNESGNLGWLL